MRASDVFATAIARVRVNRIVLADAEVRKERRLGAGAVIAMGNVYFRFAGALFRMFPSIARWVEHERRMFRLLHDRDVRRDGRAIVMPRLPGRDLATILAVEDDSTKTRALVAAGAALGALHRSGFSHGDVNAGNLLVDGTVARAIDFDAVHDPLLPIALRAADDVLGFVLDRARFEDDFERDVAHFVEGYGPAAQLAPYVCRLASAPSFLGESLLRARAHGISAPAVAQRTTIALAVMRRG